MSTEISITRALATLKSLNVRIEEESKRQVLTVPTRGTGDTLDVVDWPGTSAEAEAIIKKRWQGLNDLINVRNDIRRAVLLSNATTKIKIAGKEITIVEVLDYRKGLPEKTKLLNALKQNVSNVAAVTVRANTAYEKQLQEVRDNAMAGQRKHDEESMAVFLNPITIMHKPGILDPLGAAKIIEDMEAEIHDFELNADYALSESNATTKIVIENDDLM